VPGRPAIGRNLPLIFMHRKALQPTAVSTWQLQKQYSIKIQMHIKKPRFLMAFQTTINVKTIIEFLVLNNYEPEVRLG
jgi:hypothetical protein